MDRMVRPGFQVLKEEQANFLHAHSLEILARVGVRVDSPRARVMLEGSEEVHLSGGSGWGPDRAAEGQMWMNHLLSLVGEAGSVPFGGGTLGSKAFSPTLAVYANEGVGQRLRLAQGFP